MYPGQPSHRVLVLLVLALGALASLACTVAQPTATATPAPERIAVAPTPITAPAEVATAWFDLQLRLIQRTPGITPPVASRALGYTGVTLYEAIVPWVPGYQSLAGQLSDLKTRPTPDHVATYDPRIVANIALASITRHMFSNVSFENKAAIDDLEATLALQYSAGNAPDVVSRSVGQGQAVADAIYQWSRTDGGENGQSRNFPAGYAPPIAPACGCRRLARPAPAA